MERSLVRRLFPVMLLPALTCGMAVEMGGQPSVSATPARSREVALTYRGRVTAIPPSAGEVEVWIPLAKTSREQQILQRDVRSPVPYTISQDPDYGNDVLHVRLARPMPDSLDVEIGYVARLGGDERPVAEPPSSPREARRDLEARGLLTIDEEVRARAREATAGRLTRMEQARGIYEDVIRRMTYDKSAPGWGRGDTRRACQLGKGNCTDFHSLFISMARAERIPSRFKIGVMVPEGPPGPLPGYHCWAEFYTPGEGWVPVDASEAWKHPERAAWYFGGRAPDRFLISMGRDIRLVPPQRGELVNILFYPYVEVDGKAFAAAEAEVQLRSIEREAREERI